MMRSAHAGGRLQPFRAVGLVLVGLMKEAGF